MDHFKKGVYLSCVQTKDLNIKNNILELRHTFNVMDQLLRRGFTSMEIKLEHGKH
jgi:hypothetical protein